MSDKRQCTKCGNILPVHKFYKNKSYRNGVYSQCKRCHSKASKKYRSTAEYKSRVKKTNRIWRLQKCYNMTLDDYDNMFKEQGGVCFICKKPETLNQRLCVDHSHKTGKVRKLLCNQCNRVLGYTEENVDLLREFIKYIERLG